MTTFFGVPRAYTQNADYEFEVISSSDGLPSEEVRDLFQDSKGFLWFCTTEGLIRYDGYDLKTYSIANYHDKGLITNSFNEITEDEEGHLWCATDRGISRLDPTTGTFLFYNTQSPDSFRLSFDYINSIAIDHDQQIWVGTAGNGIDLFSPENGIIDHFSIDTPELGMNSNWITKILADSQNNIWICTWQGSLSLINQKREILKSWTNKELNISVPEFSPFSLLESFENHYWLGLWEGGLLKFQLHNNDSVSIENHVYLKKGSENSIAGNIVYDVIKDKKNDLWVGTPYGLTRIENPESSSPIFHQFKHQTGQRSISQNETYALLCDNGGLIWIGTLGGGVNKINNKIKKFKTYTIPDIFPSRLSQSVTAFTTDRRGRLLVGVRSLGFGSYDLNTGNFVHFSDLPPYEVLSPEINTINCFFQDNKGNLWLGTRYRGLIKFNPETGRHVEMNKITGAYGFESREVFDIYQDHLGFIWVGTENGLYKIIPYGNGEFHEFSVLRFAHNPGDPFSLSSDRISKILEDSNETLWVSTFDRGLNRLTSNIQTHFPLTFQRFLSADEQNNGLITDHILTLFEDSRKYLWIGSGGAGILRWHPVEKRFKTLNAEVAGNVIFNISEDAENNLWISSNRGLTKLNVKDDDLKFNTFLQDNGLQGNIFIKNSFYKDSSGYFYFGGNNGFNYFDPLTIFIDTLMAPVVITEVEVMNQPVSLLADPDKPLVLSHLKNNFSVTFAALSYSQPENNKYALQLEGLEDDWRVVDASMRTTNYAHLKPGVYILKIKGTNSDGYWNPEPATLRIRVRPAPYKTWWAFSIYALLFIGFLFFAIRMSRKNQKVKHALEIEHIERQKSDKLNRFKQDLFADISHEFLTPLNILSFLIEEWKHPKNKPTNQDIALAERNIQRLTRFNRQFLYYSKAELEQLSLSVSKANLNKFVDNICENFIPLARKKNIKFNCNISPSDQQCWFDPEKIDIILHNLLSNAFKFTPPDGKIAVEMRLSTKEAQTNAHFSITDTGIGIERENQLLIFNRFYSIKNNKPENKGFGIGLSLTKSMIEAHKGQLFLNSSPGEGTHITFLLPVSKNAFTSEEINTSLKGKTPSHQLILEDIEEEMFLKIRNLNKGYGHKPSILIIEDHAGFRKVLKSHLEKLFDVLEATNGVSGLKIIRGKQVDLILSDVVMAQMGGLELCQKLKNDPKTSQIPIILLTAKVSEKERALGYKAGADSYMSKPVNIRTLLSRIQALLDRQKRNQISNSNSYSKEKGFKTPSQDDVFLTKAQEVVEQHLQDSSLSVQMLAREMAISNSMLYRKVSELLGISPNDFIRKIKLQTAKEMLIENNISISEIAFKCGFKDVSYFGYTFKKEYGVTPTSYRKNNLGKN